MWEYLTVEISGDVETNVLNDYGSQGWELISVVNAGETMESQYNEWYHCYYEVSVPLFKLFFKRKVEDGSQD